MNKITRFKTLGFLLAMVMAIMLACSQTASPSPEPATAFSADPLGDIVPVSFKPTWFRIFSIYNTVQDGENIVFTYGDTNNAESYLTVIEDYRETADLYKVYPEDLVDFIVDRAIGSTLSSAKHRDRDTDLWLSAHPGKWFIVYPARYGNSPSLFERPVGVMIYVQEVSKEDGVNKITTAIKWPGSDTMDTQTFSNEWDHPMATLTNQKKVATVLDRAAIRSFWDAASGGYDRPNNFFERPDRYGIFSKAQIEAAGEAAVYTIYPATVVASGAMPALSQLAQPIRVSQVFDGQLDTYGSTRVTYTLIRERDSVWLVQNMDISNVAKAIFIKNLSESALMAEEPFTIFYAPIEVAAAGSAATQ